MTLVLLATAGGSCGRAERVAEPARPVAVGALVPLTGPGSEMGPKTREGFLLYWERNPSLLGRSVRPLVDDNKGNPRDGLAAFYAIKARGGDDLVLLLTQLSGVAAAIAPNTTSAKFIQFGMAASPALLKYPWNYRTYASAARIGEKLATAPAIASNVNRIYILAMADEYARAVADAFKAAAAKNRLDVVGEDLFPADATDTTGVVQKALAAKPDAIVVTGFGRSPVSCIRRLRELGFKGAIFGDPAAAYKPYTKMIGDAAEGLYVVDLDFPSDNPVGSAATFRRAFLKKYNREPDLGNVLSYASLEIFAEAVRRAKSVDPVALAPVLDAGFTVETALGTAHLTGRDTQFPLVLKVVRNGEARRVE
ncbi:MAG TPA: ABC transporter substrate-binding protein [Hyphomicrobiaceae bacterium]|nr:ABC transporter substrate-binding protein [Hyphomicrobiaceae bacterium]